MRPKNNDTKEGGKGKKNINTPKPPQGKYNFNWVNWLLVVFLLFLAVFFNRSGGPKEISWSEMEDTLLTTNAIERIVVVNKEIAEIYLKKDLSQEPELKEVTDGRFSTDKGPHYFITIGSVESFENKLQQAQEDAGISDNIDVRYENRTSWTSVLSWL